jgi:hypothetical protein
MDESGSDTRIQRRGLAHFFKMISSFGIDSRYILLYLREKLSCWNLILQFTIRALLLSRFDLSCVSK